MGEGSTGTRWKEGGSPKFAVAPVKLTVNALQDIFASNWFPWDAPSRTPCARGGTSPSSHRSAAASQVPCILRPSSFGDALVSSQHTAVPAASSWHFRVPCGRSPSREGGGQEGLSCLCPGRKRWLRHTSRWCSSETASCGPKRGGGGTTCPQGWIWGRCSQMGCFFPKPPSRGNKRLFLQRLGQVSCH